MEETRPAAGDGFRHELFVVHAAADHGWVHGYLLPELGLPAGAVLTPAGFTPGASRAAELERGVEGARLVVLVLSPAFLDDAWSELGELLASHAQVAGAAGRLVPLLLEPCQLPPRVDFRVRLDCTRQDRWPAEVGRLRQLLGRAAPPPERIECPYPGLVAFDQAQARFFFGRAREVDDLARRLPRQGLVMVIGPSGSGKSSLVFAGLLPRLAAGAAEPAGAWMVRSLRPGPAPTRALAEAVAEPPPPGGRLLLVVDQLEELFAQAPAGERDRFLAELVRLRRAPDRTLLLTLRADFYPDLMGSPLWPLTEGERLELAPLRDDALREAIAEPAAAVGVYVERALVERLLTDAASEPGVLPLLQETMAMLWERRSRRLLTLDAYRRLGGDGPSGLATALATRADAAFAELTPARQAIARRMLLRLVQLGEGRDDTRRQQPLAALRAVADDPADFDATLLGLTRHRLLTLSGDRRNPAGQDTSRADLAHEALIAAWPALRRWVDEDREGLRVRARLADDVQVWTSLGRDPDALYRGTRLLAAIEWAERHPGELSPAEQEFLAAGRRHQASELAEAREQAARQTRAARRLRWSAAALSVLLILAGLATVGAVRSAAAERRQARIATSRYLASQAANTAATDPDLSVLLSLTAYASSPTAEARLSLQDQLVRRRHVRRILTGARGRLTDVAASADGRVLAAGSADGRVWVWDGDGRKLLATLGPAVGRLRAVAVSPDGATVAAAGEDGTWLWAVADPDRRRPLGDRAGRADSLAFTPDGRLLAAGPGGRVLVWDLASGRSTPLETGDGPIDAIAATPDGRGVLALGRRGAALWRLDGHRVAFFPLRSAADAPSGGARGALAVSPDGTSFAMTRQYAGTELWDLKRRALKARDRFTYGTAIGFGSGADNRTVALLDVIQATISVYRPTIQFGRERGPPGLLATATLSGHAGDVLDLAGRPDRTVASAGADGRVILWSTRPNTNNLTDESIDGANRVDFSGDGRMLVVVDRDGVTVFDTARRKRWGQLPGPKDAALSPDGRTLATGGVAGVVALYDLGSKRLVGQLRWAAKGLSVDNAGVDISPDGRWLMEKSQTFRRHKNSTVVDLQEQVVVVWDLARRRKLTQLRAGPPGLYAGDNDSDVAFSPDGAVLAYARNDAEEVRGEDVDRVALWDVPNRRELGAFDAPEVEALAFAPAGDVLAVGYRDRIELRDARSQAVRKTVRIPQSTAQHLSFSPDGRQLATSGSRGARLWDVSDPATVPVLAGTLVDRDDIGSGSLDPDVAFSPDSRLLAVADGGPEIILWDLVDTTAWQRSLCQMLDRGFSDQERRRFFPDGRVPNACPG